MTKIVQIVTEDRRILSEIYLELQVQDTLWTMNMTKSLCGKR